jgi:hypothetical protein
MTRVSDWIDELVAATKTAEAAETAYRAEYAKRVAALAQERAFAFRRATLRARLGWDFDSEARDEIVSRFAPVCAALREDDEAQAKDAADPAEALAAFEAWHIEARGVPFWVLFEKWMPETPVVDF